MTKTKAFKTWAREVQKVLDEGEQYGYGGMAFLSGAAKMGGGVGNVADAQELVRKGVEKGAVFMTSAYNLRCIPYLLALMMDNLDQDDEVVDLPNAHAISLSTIGKLAQQWGMSRNKKLAEAGKSIDKAVQKYVKHLMKGEK